MNVYWTHTMYSSACRITQKTSFAFCELVMQLIRSSAHLKIPLRFNLKDLSYKIKQDWLCDFGGGGGGEHTFESIIESHGERNEHNMTGGA